MNEVSTQSFLEPAENWLCENYWLDIRYFAVAEQDGLRIWDACVRFNPLPPPRNHTFQIESDKFAIGQIQRLSESKSSSMDLLHRAANGVVDLPTKALGLNRGEAFRFYSEMTNRERWFSELHLQVSASHGRSFSPSELANIDNFLRQSQPPFDGLGDAAQWLGLNADPSAKKLPSIDIYISPPVDLMFDKCSLADGTLSLILHAHEKFDSNRVGLALRVLPGYGLDARQQISDKIAWSQNREGLLEGVATIKVENADSVLVMLMIEGLTVRRQVFIDPEKARNNRLLAVQYFDKNLAKIKSSVFDDRNSRAFEKGVAALLFLLGFSPAAQIEDESPDLIVTTPGGLMAIVECTIKTADFSAKLGKLVDRRNGLSKALKLSGHPSRVAAVLICRLPRDQIATFSEEVAAHNTILITAEGLSSAFNGVRTHNDPDKMLEAAMARVAANANPDLESIRSTAQPQLNEPYK
jgi:hypothetical protein